MWAEGDTVSILQTLGTGQGYLKAGFLGFPKSGKTYTATDVAIGTYKFFGNAGRIIMFDTEGGSEYIAHRVRQGTGQELIGVKSRSFADLMAVAKETRTDDILLADSITHPWRELCDAHLARINQALERRGSKKRRYKLEFQDWGPIKAEWDKWTTFYLNSKVHIIICGRAGYEYDMEKSEDDNGNEKKELVKVGTKMKTESEFGFEPSLLVEMFRDDSPEGKKANARLAVIRGDRFDIIDGKVFKNPTFKDFLPHIQMLKPGAHTAIDTELKSDTGVTDEGDIEWQREKRTRVILCEEIQGIIVSVYPGQTAAEKQAKGQLLFDAFGTRSWTAVENMNSDDLRHGMERIKTILAAHRIEKEGGAAA